MGKLNKIWFLIATITLFKILIVVLFPLEINTFENFDIARNYVQHGEMFYTLDGNVDYSHQFPFYGWILILFRLFFGEAKLPIVFFQIVLSGFFSYVVIEILRFIRKDWFFNNWVVFLILSLCLLHPALLYYQLTSTHPVTMDVFLFSLLILVGLRWQENNSIKNATIFFTVIGISLLERFTLITALTPFVFWSLKNHKKILSLVVITTLSFSFFLLPWMYRNYVKTEKFEMTSGTWRYLWVGIQEKTNGTNTLPNGESYYELFPDEVKINWGKKNLDEQLDFYKSDFKKTIHDNPYLFLKMWFVKLKNFFLFSNSFGNQSNVNSLFIALYKLFHTVTLVFAIIGLITANNKFRILFVGCLFLGILQSFFYIESRHLAPALFILIIFFAEGLLFLKEKLFR
ncbi:MAG: hypothetical protein ACLGGV_03605 [Bacteroidia bacterium]